MTQTPRLKGPYHVETDPKGFTIVGPDVNHDTGEYAVGCWWTDRETAEDFAELMNLAWQTGHKAGRQQEKA